MSTSRLHLYIVSLESSHQIHLVQCESWMSPSGPYFLYMFIAWSRLVNEWKKLETKQHAQAHAHRWYVLPVTARQAKSCSERATETRPTSFHVLPLATPLNPSGWRVLLAAGAVPAAPPLADALNPWGHGVRLLLWWWWYVYVYLCTCVCVALFLSPYIYIYIHKYINIYIHIYILYICMYINLFRYSSLYKYIYICRYIII